MAIRISGERRDLVLGALETLYHDEFDEELSRYRAERLLDFFVRALGPAVYNQAIQDARGFLQERLDDLDAEFYEPDESYGPKEGR